MDQDNLKMEQLQQYLDSRKSEVAGDIAEYDQQMKKNYVYFFGWHADDLYKAHYMENNYKALQEVIDNAQSPKEIAAYLNKCILYVEDDLLNGPLVKRSTSQMTNISHSLELECKQKLLKVFLRLNKILQSETVSEKVEPKETPKQGNVPPKEKKKPGPRLR